MARKPSSKEWSSGLVLSKLEKTTFSAPAHSMLREVRNATGYSKTARSADALVVSLWPSRGIWFAGIEVKVARYDWLRELKDPEKSADIQRFCNYWWIAAPAGVVELSELPETWGLIEVGGTKNEMIKQAPRLTPEVLQPDFVAAIFRNMAAEQNSARGKIRAELVAELGEPDVHDVAVLRREIDHLKLLHKSAVGRHEALERQVTSFKAATGVDLQNPYVTPNPGAAYNLACRIQRNEMSNLAKQLETLAADLRAANVKLSE